MAAGDPGQPFAGAAVCPRCGRSFVCGMKAGHARCWCAELPPGPPPDPTAGGCYCPDCLAVVKAGQPGRASG